MRRHLVISYSRNSPHFIQPEGSLPHSQQPATCPGPESDRSNPCPPSRLSKIRFNIIQSTPGSSKWSSSLRFPHQNRVCTSPLSHTCYIPCPSQSSFSSFTCLIPCGFINFQFLKCVSVVCFGLGIWSDRISNQIYLLGHTYIFLHVT